MNACIYLSGLFAWFFTILTVYCYAACYHKAKVVYGTIAICFFLLFINLAILGGISQ